MEEKFDYSAGDIIELLVDKEGYNYSYSSYDKNNEVWKKGTKLVISRVYYDGDVYATKGNVSRMVRKEEFKVYNVDLSSVVIGKVAIHSNVNSELINNHYKRIKEEEEKKKKAEEKMRDEYQRIYGTRYPTDYQLHPEKYKREETDYSTKYFNFYEWSNLESIPRKFTTLKYFIDFLDNSKIHYTPEDKSHLSTLTYAYCTCTKGKPDLLIANTVYGLRELLDRFSSSDESEEKAETDAKWILCKDTNRYTYLRTVTYNKDGDVSSFTFCDIKSEAYVFTDKEKALKVSEDISKKTADFINLTPVGLLN